MRTVLPDVFHWATISRSSRMAEMSRFEVGSSNTRIGGLSILTEAQAIFCFSPPESWETFYPSSFSSRKS